MEDWIEGYPVRHLALWKREAVKEALTSNKAFQRTARSTGAEATFHGVLAAQISARIGTSADLSRTFPESSRYIPGVQGYQEQGHERSPEGGR